MDSPPCWSAPAGAGRSVKLRCVAHTGTPLVRSGWHPDDAVTPAPGRYVLLLAPQLVSHRAFGVSRTVAPHLPELPAGTPHCRFAMFSLCLGRPDCPVSSSPVFLGNPGHSRLCWPSLVTSCCRGCGCCRCPVTVFLLSGPTARCCSWRLAASAVRFCWKSALRCGLAGRIRGLSPVRSSVVPCWVRHGLTVPQFRSLCSSCDSGWTVPVLSLCFPLVDLLGGLSSVSAWCVRRFSWDLLGSVSPAGVPSVRHCCLHPYYDILGVQSLVLCWVPLCLGTGSSLPGYAIYHTLHFSLSSPIFYSPPMLFPHEWVVGSGLHSYIVG